MDYAIIPYDEKYRDDMIFMVLEAKDAIGRIPRLNEDLLDVQKNYIDTGDMFWLAIDEHDRVVGCIGYNSIPVTSDVRLHRLYIKATRKRQGIGTRLLHTVERHLREQGKTAAHVHLGGKEYFESRSFYPKHGYQEYAPDMMKKEINMEILHLSKQYSVRDLFPQDAEMVYEVLKKNTTFYKYHPPMVTIENILEDMEVLPPNKEYEDKHYIGFFGEGILVAVMDLIERYPNQETALLGFFAMNANLQGQGIGTQIISDSVAYLAQVGFKKVRLGIDKGNPQSKAFWLKNGFGFTGEEYESNGSTILVMERKL